MQMYPGVYMVKGGLFRKFGFDIPPPRVQVFWRNAEEWEKPLEGVEVKQ